MMNNKPLNGNDFYPQTKFQRRRPILTLTHIRSKVLAVILSIVFVIVTLLSVTRLMSIFSLSDSFFEHSEQLGRTAAENSEKALREWIETHLLNLAEDKATLIEERLLHIQNHTKMIADTASRIYTYKNQYLPRSIGYLEPHQVGTAVPHLRTAPGVSLESIRQEVYLAANITDILSHITATDMGIVTNYIGGESGYFITVDTAAVGPRNTNYDVTKRSWYVGAKQTGNVFWTDVFMDASGRGASIACAAPFYDLSNGGRVFKGVACSGSFVTVAAARIIDSIKIGGTGYAFLLNNAGQVVLSSQKTESAGYKDSLAGKDFLHGDDAVLRDIARRMVNRENGLLDGVEVDGEPVYIAYHPLSNIDLSMGIVAPVEEFLDPAKQIEQDILSITKDEIAEINRSIIRNIIFSAVVIIAAIGIAVFAALKLSHALTEPVVSLSKGAKIIGDGDLDYQLEVKTGDELELLAGAFNQMVGNIKHITTEKERIGAELNVATRIQASMLPHIFPPFPDQKEFDLYGSMLPAKEVGGDFYDFFLRDENTLMFLIADVSGKGVPAALFMVIAKTLLKNNVQHGMSPHEVFETVNNQLCVNNEEGMFVTAFMGYLDIQTGAFTCVNAGHNPPLIKRENGFEWLKIKRGLVLGSIANRPYREETLTLKKGDMVYLYTDGVTEARDSNRALFCESRLLEAARKYQNAALKEFVVGIKQEIDAFADGAEQADDITMLALQYWGAAAPEQGNK